MPRKYVRKTDQQSWDSDNMLRAIDAVRNNEMGLLWASKTFSIPKSTLLRRIKDINNEATLNKKVLGSMRPVFSEEQEEELVDYLLDMEKRYYGLSTRDIRSLAFQYAEKNKLKHSFNRDVGLAGVDWLSRFRKRHPEFSLRTETAVTSKSAKKPNVEKFFNLLKSTVEEKTIPPNRIFSLDETGVTMSRKDFTLDGKKKGNSSGEKQLLSTAVICMSATGDFIPPMLIFPRLTMKQELQKGAPEGTVFACHPSGWMQQDSFMEWFYHFIKYAKPTEEDPVLLILDDHITHTKTLSFTELSRRNNVHILCFPPQCSKNMKPLDLYFLGSLNTCYVQTIEKFLQTNPGKDVTQFEVSSLFGEAFSQAATSEAAKHCFSKTGILPYNPDILNNSDCVQPKSGQVILCTKTFAISEKQDESDNEKPNGSVSNSIEKNEEEDGEKVG